ncbi:hypothetical protein [Demequina flava]|uniref:hypothetical protein n=1 Tax=Demequina flava TaxID=1095025 RepID=UPI0007806A45|nr:hypothetical protein [Demequina flava]
MTFPRRRRAAVGALAGSAIVLTGCTVPGQDGAASSAIEYDSTTISNERVSELYDAWTQEGHVNITRRGVITLEVMREPMLENVDALGIGYSRDFVEGLGEELKATEGVEGAPSEDLIDGLEAAYLLGAFALLDQTGEQLSTMAADLTENSVSSPRTGDFSEPELVNTLNLVAPAATNRLNSGDRLWLTEFTGVNAFVEPDEDWIASE